MITKLISDNAPRRQITKRHMVFNKISNNRILFSFREYTNYLIRGVILRRPRAIRHYRKKPFRFNLFNNTDTFANFALDSNPFSLTGVSFSTASSRIHDECSYDNYEEQFKLD
jgi:hypothetical protein